VLLRRNRSEPRPRRRRRRIRKVRLVVLVGMLGVLILTAFSYGVTVALSRQLAGLDPFRQQHVQVDGYVYAGDGHTILAVLRGSQSRVLVQSQDISGFMKQAIVATEDKRFYEHRGVDIRGMARALWADIRHKGAVQGGSTITQQFVKNELTGAHRSITRKLKEAALAWQLEQRWSKDKILTAYLNTIYFGNGTYGVERAARTYFGHNAKKLTLPEAALLAGIPEDPSLYDPVAHPSDARDRRATVLGLMLQQGAIARADYRRALRAPMPKPQNVHLSGVRGLAPYFGEYVKSQLIDHHAQLQAAGARTRGDPQVAPKPDRSAGRARCAEPAHRRGARDVRRQQLQPEPVQPRRARRAPAGFGVQAVRARDGAEGGHLAPDDVRLAPRVDLPR
jgi:penicillin-binding protein 1A